MPDWACEGEGRTVAVNVLAAGVGEDGRVTVRVAVGASVGAAVGACVMVSVGEGVVEMKGIEASREEAVEVSALTEEITWLPIKRSASSAATAPRDASERLR